MKKTKIIAFFGILTFILISFSIPSTIFAPAKETGSSADPLLIGKTSFGYDLDPANAWDSASYDIIHQVSEGLFAYDLGDQYLRTVPRLAADCGTWSEDHLEFTVILREGVTFHNGNPFNAAAVKASFDRLIHLVEIGVVQTAGLYEPLNGKLVIAEMVVVDEYTVKFVLNYVFAPFVSLLCFTASMIVDASVMPADDIISPYGTLIGTGPYKYLSNDGEKLEFEYYPEYYRGTPAVKKFNFIKYETSSEISAAFLAGDVHMGSYDPDFLINFLGSDKLTVEQPKPGSIITYMGMNNILINQTIRQAISYSIDYDYIIHNIYRDLIVRMTSVIPPGIAYHQPQNVATYDVSKARRILIEAGLSQGLDEDSEDSEWIALSESSHPIASYNYTFNQGSVPRPENNIGEEALTSLSLIGISLELTGVTWIEFLYKLYFYHNELNLYVIGWMPDYNDPFTYINPLFSPNSMSNSAQVNDPWLQEKMMEGLTEFNETARAQIYYDIQEYIATDLMPWVFIGFNNGISVHSNHVTDLQRNAMGYFYVFPLTWYGEKAEITDEFFQYCNTCGAPPEAEKERIKLPGYNLIVMLGIDAATVISIINGRKKCKRNHVI